jgi:hypothetical protein
MECTHFQERLSDYLEGLLSGEDKTQFDEHLQSCSRCRESLSDLARTVEYVRDLKEVEPPPWLTQQVMTKIKEETEAKKSFFTRLFPSSGFKLPKEAIATVIIAIALIFVVRSMRPVMQEKAGFEPAPAEKVAPQVPAQEKGFSKLDRKEEKEAAGKASTPSSVISRDEVPKRSGESPVEKEIVGSKPSRPAGQDKIEEKRGKASVQINESVQQIPAKGSAVPEKAAEAPALEKNMGTFAGAVKTEESAPKAIAPSIKKKIEAEKAKRSVRLTLIVQSVESAAQEVEELAKLLGGKVTKTESYENKTVLSGTLPAKNMREFIEKLNMMGEIREKQIPSAISEGDMDLTVEVGNKP